MGCFGRLAADPKGCPGQCASLEASQFVFTVAECLHPCSERLVKVGFYQLDTMPLRSLLCVPVKFTQTHGPKRKANCYIQGEE